VKIICLRSQKERENGRPGKGKETASWNGTIPRVGLCWTYSKYIYEVEKKWAPDIVILFIFIIEASWQLL
jgi:hypothetical protein